MRRLLGLTAAMVVATASCGLPNSNNFVATNHNDDRFGLSQTTAATTTTAPTTTIDATTTTIEQATSTTIASDLVELFFITSRQLTNISTPLPRSPTLSQVVAALLQGPPSGDLGAGLRTALPSLAQITVTSEAGIATVDLPPGVFDAVEPNDQRLVFGQIVLTLTGRPGVGPVRFTLAGEPTRVFRGDGSLTKPGEEVSRDDYVTLLSNSPEPPTIAPRSTDTSSTSAG